MELKAGYKQTEVGVIPEDWDVMTLSQTARGIFRGASPRPIENPIWFEDASDVGWVRIADVTKSGRHLTETTQRLSKQGILHSRFVPCGSLIMSICATVGRPIETRLDVCIHDGFVVFDRPLTDQGYLYHVLKDLEPRWASKGQTGSQMNLNGNLIKSTIVPAPSTKAEQEAIAEALSDADALIESLDQLITKKRNLKQAAMQQLLTGQTRLPGFSGEWEVKRVAEFGDVVTGGTPRTDVKEYWGEGYPWITPTDISSLRDLTTSERTVTESGLNSIRTLPANTVLVTCIASIGKNAILKFKGGCNQQINAVISNARNSAEFLYYLFEASKQYLLSNAGTTATSIISKATFEEMTFVVPLLPEQTAIATILSDMDTELAELEARLAKARHIKQGMMQELLTGRIRLL
jgi:type I restriction enzyme S subunit